MQEIFNKVDQNQLQRTKNVGKFLDAAKTLSISPEALATEPKWLVGHHPLQNRWMIVSYAQGAVANSLLLPH